MSETQQLKNYESTIYKIALRTIYELFQADKVGEIKLIALNGWVNAINKGTGKRVNNCILRHCWCCHQQSAHRQIQRLREIIRSYPDAAKRYLRHCWCCHQQSAHRQIQRLREIILSYPDAAKRYLLVTTPTRAQAFIIQNLTFVVPYSLKSARSKDRSPTTSKKLSLLLENQK